MIESRFVKEILKLGFIKYENYSGGFFNYDVLYQYKVNDQISINIQYYILELVSNPIYRYEIEIYDSSNGGYALKKKYYSFQSFIKMVQTVNELLDFYKNE